MTPSFDVLRRCGYPMVPCLQARDPAAIGDYRFSYCERTCARLEEERVDPIVVAFGTALVGAMATDVWQRARASVVTLWRRVHPQQADTVEADLEGLRGQILDARQAGRADTEQALTGVWQGRLQQLLLDEPGVAAELQRVLDDPLTPALPPAEQARIGTLIMTGISHDTSTFTQVAGNQINYRS
jgi:hypothetical protein